MKYAVDVEGRSHQIEIQGDQVLVDGQPLEVDIRRIGDLPLYSLLVNSQSAEVSVEEAARFQYRVMLAGELYAVAVRPAGSGAWSERPRQSTDNVVRAPMPGLVAAVPVVEGQEVKAGQVVIVLESMKMENPLMAPADATVQAVHVQPGDSVERNQVVISLQLKRRAADGHG